MIADVAHLDRTRYAGANHAHLSELLAEREGIHIGQITLRSILLDAGVSSRGRRRPQKHRVRRQRMPREGMLIQVDGSHHPWLGDHAPPFTLLIAVDDDTGTVVDGLFCGQEDSHNYFLLIHNLVQRCGIPVALYTDRHAVFRHTPGSGLPGMAAQFSRAMDELGIQMIFARSPQAKGRVERTAGTFQDRLVTELRVAGASDIREANRVLEQFLPRFNRRFGVPPQHPEPAFRPLDPELCLEGLDGRLSVRHERRLIAVQEAAPSPVFLRNGHGCASPVPVPASGAHGLGERRTATLKPLDAWIENEKDPVDKNNGLTAAGNPKATSPHKPTFLQRERWKAIQKARRKGMSLQAIERELGLHRSTITKYLRAEGPARSSSATLTT